MPSKRMLSLLYHNKAQVAECKTKDAGYVSAAILRCVTVVIQYHANCVSGQVLCAILLVV